MVNILSQSDKKHPRYYKLDKISHIILPLKFSYSREIIYWHEKARTGFLKNKIIFSQ